MDCIPRTAEAWPMDALSSMSIIAGYRAVAVAANLLPKMFCPAESGAGRVDPASVLVIGAGMVGMQSIRSAIGLGARTFAVDISEKARQRARQAGAEILGFNLPAAGAAANAATLLPEELLERERQELADILPRMDVVIAGILILGEHAPVLITEEMVRTMRPGSVIVDVAIDQGGNCQLSRRGQTFVDEASGVTISAIMNLPGQVPVHSTMLYAQNVCNLLLDACRPPAAGIAAADIAAADIATSGKTEPQIDLDRPILRAATVTRDGQIVHEGTLHALAGA